MAYWRGEWLCWPTPPPSAPPTGRLLVEEPAELVIPDNKVLIFISNINIRIRYFFHRIRLLPVTMDI